MHSMAYQLRPRETNKVIEAWASDVLASHVAIAQSRNPASLSRQGRRQRLLHT